MGHVIDRISPEWARKYFAELFYGIYNDKDYKIEQNSIINFTLFYIAKNYNDRVEEMFDCDDILCYPFHTKYKIEYDGNTRTYECNRDKFEPEHFYAEMDIMIEKVHQYLENYISEYIENHNDKINVQKEKLDAEAVIMNNHYISNSLYTIFYKNLEESENAGQVSLHGIGPAFVMLELLDTINVPAIIIEAGPKYIEKCRKTIYYRYHRAVNEYAMKSLALIAEKLYFYTLSEVKKVVDKKKKENNNPTNINPISGIDMPQQSSQPILPQQQLVQSSQPVLPQQLVSYDNAYVQGIMNNMMNQPFSFYQVPEPQSYLNSNIYMPMGCPIGIEYNAESVPQIQVDYEKKDDNQTEATANNNTTNNGFRILSINELQEKINSEEQTAATGEQSNLLRIDPDSINSYNALDTYNKYMTCLFAQIILKYKNGVVQ